MCYIQYAIREQLIDLLELQQRSDAMSERLATNNVRHSTKLRCVCSRMGQVVVDREPICAEFQLQSASTPSGADAECDGH